MKTKIKLFGLLMLCVIAFTACDSDDKDCKEDCKKECCVDKEDCDDDCEKKCCADKKEACCEDGEKCEHHKKSDADSTDLSSTMPAHDCTEVCDKDGCTAKTADKEACAEDCEKECCKAA